METMIQERNNMNVDEKKYIKTLNTMNEVAHLGLQIVPKNQKELFYSKWQELREMIESWKNG